MKKLVKNKSIILLAFICLPMVIAAQAPQKMQMQAVIRNLSNQLIINTTVGIKSSIILNIPFTTVYSETHIVTTDINGIATIQLGNGTVVSGNFSTINWKTGTYSWKTEIDLTGGNTYTITNTSQLLSVPYALFANNANDAEWKQTGNTLTDSLNFIGTKNYVPFNLKVNNQKSGKIDPIIANTSFGYKSAKNTTTGQHNTTYGTQSTELNTIENNNTAIGFKSLNQNNASNNTGIGINTLISNTTGKENTALGSNTLASNTIGDENSSVGDSALYLNDASQNTAIGKNALSANETGVSNTAIGANALKKFRYHFNNAMGTDALSSNDAGSTNTAFGANTLKANTYGNENVANGANALNVNTLGNYNTAIGFNTLKKNVDGNLNIAIGNNALANNINGNEQVAIGDSALFNIFTTFNTVPNTIPNTAIGDHALFNSRTSNAAVAIGAYSLYTDSLLSYNTALGNYALYSNKTGTLNTALGNNSLFFNTTGNNNSALGMSALYNCTTGNNNTAVGNGSLNQITTQSNNTAVGYASFSVGNHNTAVGLYSGSTGSFCTTFGKNSTSSGDNNTIIGSLADGGTGHDNTVVGSKAHRLPSNPSYNVAVGHSALEDVTNANRTTGLGQSSGTNGTPFKYSDYNTFLGSYTNNPYASGGGTNSTVIGDAASVVVSNKIRLGDAGIAVVEGQVAFSYPSDARFKYDIQENVPGIAFIKKLQPVTYNFDTKKYQNHIMKNMPDSTKSKLLEGKNLSNSNVVQTGFLAQDIEKVCKDLNYDFDGLHIPENESDNYSVAYSQFVMPLVKGMQEQQTTISNLKNQNDNLEKRLLAIKEKLDKK